MIWNQWTFIDYIFVLIVVVSTGFAIRKGLAREAISLVSLIGGFLLAAFYYSSAAALFVAYTSNQAVANLLGFVVIFLGCLLVGAIAAFIANRFIKMAALEWVDHLLGALYGFFRGCAVACIIALALIAFPVRQDTLADSFFAPFLLAGAGTVVLMVPQELKDKFHNEYQKVLEHWNSQKDSA